MRKTKTIKIDDKEIIVNELRVKDIRSMLAGSEKIKGAGDIIELLPAAVNLEPSEIEEYAPSELKTIYDAFKEVNEVFFGLAAKSGMFGILKNSIQKNLTDAFAALSPPDTE